MLTGAPSIRYAGLFFFAGAEKNLPDGLCHGIKRLVEVWQTAVVCSYPSVAFTRCCPEFINPHRVVVFDLSESL